MYRSWPTSEMHGQHYFKGMTLSWLCTANSQSLGYSWKYKEDCTRLVFSYIYWNLLTFAIYRRALCLSEFDRIKAVLASEREKAAVYLAGVLVSSFLSQRVLINVEMKVGYHRPWTVKTTLLNEQLLSQRGAEFNVLILTSF